MLLPGKTIGVLGGGQLGRMFAHAAERLGYRVHIYEPAADSPAGEVAAVEVNAPYDDLPRLREFARGCGVVTYEFENIPAGPLRAIETTVTLHPHWNVLEICQHRAREKSWLRTNGFPHVPFVDVEQDGDLASAIRAIGLPCVVKTAAFGYDGKGQMKIKDEASIPEAVAAFAGQRAVVEKFISFRCEVSVIVARAASGEARPFPVVENIHTNHILDYTLSPARVSDAVRAKAEALGQAIAERLGVVGLLAIELFVTEGDEILVNELAPRPHNSGHVTMDACITSQFEQHVRAVCGLPLGDVTQTTPAVMVNILGDAWSWRGDEVIAEPDWAVLLHAPEAKLHLYGKREPRIGRKMGHFTVRGATVDAAFAAARELKAKLQRASS